MDLVPGTALPAIGGHPHLFRMLRQSIDDQATSVNKFELQQLGLPVSGTNSRNSQNLHRTNAQLCFY